MNKSHFTEFSCDNSISSRDLILVLEKAYNCFKEYKATTVASVELQQGRIYQNLGHVHYIHLERERLCVNYRRSSGPFAKRMGPSFTHKPHSFIVLKHQQQSFRSTPFPPKLLFAKSQNFHINQCFSHFLLYFSLTQLFHSKEKNSILPSGSRSLVTPYSLSAT